LGFTQPVIYTESMPTPHERTPQERETLMFPNPEEAREFSERAHERLQREQQPGLKRDREIVGEEVAQEFERRGEPVEIIREPWDHTHEEHEEVQTLIDTAFEKDLGVALRKAKHSPHYPRNLDLFHDVLTSQMYELITQRQLNKQPLAIWVAVIVGAVLGVLAFVIVLLALSA
jgi:hypothetical protein